MEWVDLGGPNDIVIEFLLTPDGNEAIKSQSRKDCLSVLGPRFVMWP